MALPAGVTTATVTVGSSASMFGDTATIKATVTPNYGGARRIIWTATGQVFPNFAKTFEAAAGGSLSFPLPHVNQAGFVDPNGNAYTMWAYTVDVTISSGSQTATYTQTVQPLTGQATIDLDLVPDGTIAAPLSAPVPAVTSVNGQTGAVIVSGGGTTPDATTTVKGVVQLAGDLAGTAAAPTVPGKVPTSRTVNGKALTANITLAKADVGLGNVDNTADASKPISTATQNALDDKADVAHSHDGADIDSGVIAVARLGTGTPDVTKYLRGDGSWSLPTTSQEKMLLANSTLAATTTYQSTSPALSVTVAAGGVYYIDGVIYYTTSTIAKLKVSATFAGMTSMATVFGSNSSATTSTASMQNDLLNVSDSGKTQQGVDGLTSVLRIGGVLIGTTGGTFELKFAQTNTDTIAPVILAGSYLIATPRMG